MSGNTPSTGSVEVRGIPIRYWHLDRGRPDTVLFLHGLGGDHRGLVPLADALCTVNVVIPDLPGYGESGPLAQPHGLVNYADAIADLRAALGLTECHLLGHSLGGSIALVHAARHGAGLRGLCLLNPVSTASNITAALGKIYYGLAARMPARLARFWLASRLAVYISDAFIIATKDRAVRRSILDQDYENYRRASVPAMIESFLSYYDTPFEDTAATITTRTLLITGGRDRIAPVAAVRALAGRMPDARLVIEPDAGHLMPMELPSRTAEIVNGFLPAAVD